MKRLKKINSLVLRQYILEEGNRLIGKWIYWLDLDHFEISLSIDKDRENYIKYLGTLNTDYDEWKAEIYVAPPEIMQEVMINEHLYTPPNLSLIHI